MISMEREEMVEVFISELKRVVEVAPYQEDIFRKVLSKDNKDTTLHIVMGRHQGRTYLKNLFDKIIAE